MKNIKAIAVIIIVVAIVFLIAKSSPLATWKSSYLGVTYPPLPTGVVSNGGQIIGAATLPISALAAYVLDDVTTPTGGELWLAFSKKSNVNDRNPVMTVLDALSDPMGKNGDDLIWGHCGTAKTSDDSIVALVNSTQYGKNIPTPAIQAWKANEATGRFESILPSNIVCEASPSPD